ncbi:hypothetical protein JD508_09380 [Aeromonas jandaei]|uniref:hypothetical protein n=1 Tax=Aeromonas jandaei TaxID=650 RepID=UPI00191EE466|nr:hypothetical protein [Aeromonas jandaei]MBL0610469.1 hypothetical protein [Aeromonas jandaei]
MVVKLTLPNLVEDELLFIDNVVEQRTKEPNKTFFRDYKQEWKRRITTYLNHKGDPTIVGESNMTPNKKKFINLYSSKNLDNVQTPIINKLRDRKLVYCPSCGEDGTPNTLDHYLPKDDYPEFSILSKNLFPMCDICQGKKSTNTINEEGERLFLHPYYDSFLEMQVVHLTISKPYESPSAFSLRVNNALTPKQSGVVDRHIKSLDISGRYQNYAKDQYFRLLKLVSASRDINKDTRELLLAFKMMAATKNINSWENIFYSGVVEDQELMDYLSHGELMPLR